MVPLFFSPRPSPRGGPPSQKKKILPPPPPFPGGFRAESITLANLFSDRRHRSHVSLDEGAENHNGIDSPANNRFDQIVDRIRRITVAASFARRRPERRGP